MYLPASHLCIRLNEFDLSESLYGEVGLSSRNRIAAQQRFFILLLSLSLSLSLGFGVPEESSSQSDFAISAMRFGRLLMLSSKKSEPLVSLISSRSLRLVLPFCRATVSIKKRSEELAPLTRS